MNWTSPRWAPALAWPALLCWGAHTLVGQDTYLTLLAGREVANSGLPTVDRLTYWTDQTPWIDQQWGAQLAFYAVHGVGGLHAVLLLHVALLTGAFAIIIGFDARRAAPFSVLLAGLVAIGLASANTSARAQSFSQLAFALVIVLLARDVEKPSRRTHFVWPVLIVWANLHGGVLLGAIVVGLRGMLQLAGLGEPRRALRGLSFGVCAALSPFASAYGPRVFFYYRDLLTFPGREIITEWATPSLSREPLFFVFLPLLALVLWRARKSLTPFVGGVLVFLTITSAISSRNILWLALASAMLLPPLLDVAFPSLVERGGGAPYKALVPIFGALAFAGLVRFATTTSSALESDFPNEALGAIERATPNRATVIASDTLADWLMWKEPQLRGHVAFDVRFEVLGTERARRMRRLLFVKDDWAKSCEGADVFVLSRRHAELANALSNRPEIEAIYRDDKVTVLTGSITSP